jgi:hypothetical protein
MARGSNDLYVEGLVRSRVVREHGLEQQADEFTQQEWNKRGFKKMERTIVSGRYQNIEVTIYFNSHDAMFGAALNGVTTMTGDYKLLINKLCEIQRERESITFARYIEIDYDRRHGAKINSLTGRSWGGHDSESRPVAGLTLDFHVFDISNEFPMRYADGNGTARVWRYIQPAPKRKQSNLKYTDDGWWILIEETVNVAHHSEEKLIPFTPDRWAILCEIRAGIQTLDQRLSAMFTNKAVEKTAALLDAFVGQKLLPPPPKTKGRKR